MGADAFIHWLRGFLAAADAPTPEQWEKVRAEIAKVTSFTFVNGTPCAPNSLYARMPCDAVAPAVWSHDITIVGGGPVTP